MNPINKELLSTFDLQLGDPHFLQRAFSAVAKWRKTSHKENAIASACLEEYDALSRRLDRTQIQDSAAVRNVLRTRKLAELLVDEKGDILHDLLPPAIDAMKRALYSLGPQRLCDSRRQEQILAALEFLQQNKEAARILKNIGKPHAHRLAEQIIRNTLALPANTPVTDTHARRAALSAWLCYLRQNVGSCFATAPAIIVHDEQPLQFLKDISELLSTGRLKRTFGGHEYTVPLSASWGAGDLKKQFLFDPTKEREGPWISPGIMAGLVAAEVVDGALPWKERTLEAKSLILGTLQQQGPVEGIMLLNAEDLIQAVLMAHLKVTKKELQDYELRDRGTISTGIIMTASAVPAAGSPAQRAAQYHVRMDKARDAFKELADNALLKSWEFSLASFAETKADFTRWNLYSSLGLGADEKGGIGASIQEILQRRLDQSNRKVQEMQLEYEQLYSQLKYWEVRIKRASSEKEAQWLNIEYQSKVHEFHTLEDMRDREHRKGKQIAQLFQVLVDEYYELFQQYFQEVYDADMHEVTVSAYDDSPAGFRLLYKHGRTNTAQWTYIHNQHDFINALSSFFVATETILAHKPAFKGLEQELSEIITAIVLHVKTKEFLESALYRMAAIHKTRIVENPLEHLEMIEKKPWAYTSGGTMGSLVSCYFGLAQLPTEVGRWVENPMELLVFFIETVKQIPPKVMSDFLKEKRRSMLMHSPTHAFILKPLQEPFSQAWQNEAYTFTWVRDNLVRPLIRSFQVIDLSEAMIEHLVGQLAEMIPQEYRFYFTKTLLPVYGFHTARGFRQHVTEKMDQDKGLQRRGRPILSDDEVDSFLRAKLPLFPIGELKARVSETLKKTKGIEGKVVHKALAVYDELHTAVGRGAFGDAAMLLDTCKGILSLAVEQTSLPANMESRFLDAARGLGYALPAPIQFADTNWMRDNFAFLVNPGTEELELWRVDDLGVTGTKMTQWNAWINGSRKDIPWGIYTRPYEYLK